jgi:hypothetical protein
MKLFKSESPQSNRDQSIPSLIRPSVIGFPPPELTKLER